jgi:hypothetical protein
MSYYVTRTDLPFFEGGLSKGDVAGDVVDTNGLNDPDGDV